MVWIGLGYKRYGGSGDGFMGVWQYCICERGGHGADGVRMDTHMAFCYVCEKSPLQDEKLPAWLQVWWVYLVIDSPYI